MDALVPMVRPMALLAALACTAPPALARDAAMPASPPEAAAAPAPSGAITLRDAVAAALVRSPELAAFSAEVRAREAATLQAGLLPNPVLRTDLEDFGGSGRRAAFHSAQTTISLAQLVELGGKRAKRQRVASLERDLAGWDYEARRATVLAEVTKAFVATLAAQERLALADELVRVAAASVRTVGDQVAAGAVSPIERDRAEVALDRTRLERVQIEHDVAAAKATLAATFGAERVTFTAVRGDLARVTAPAPEAEFLARVDANPDLARWTTELEQRSAAIELERARGIPDITVGVGGRHFDEDDTSGAVVELSIPLPIFDRNQGGVREAHERLAKAKAERAAAEASVRGALGRAYQEFHAAWDQVVSLRDRVIPRARAVFDGASDAYARGLYRWLEVLDAQRTLFAVRDQYVQALATYHAARVDVERLSGTPIAGEPTAEEARP
ncbi:MAG: TolC family protein [bacterium]|nr:TolC family protein [bacterium]